MRTGAAFCLASAAAFGAMSVFGKLAFDAGATVMTVLFVRFAVAAPVFWLVAAARRTPRPRGRAARVGLALGAVGYATQAGLYFWALTRLDASLLALVLYTFPAFVTAAAIGLGRERGDRRRLAALGLSLGGTALVLVGAGAGEFDAVGAALGLGAALAYTAYILVSDTVTGELEPLALSALVTTGAAVTIGLAGAASGSLALDVGGEAWLWLTLIALVSTVVAIVLFFAGLRRVGPSTAAILSTLEPPVTVALAYLAFGEALTPVQLAGAALVLAAVVVLNARRRERVQPAAGVG